MTNCEIKGQVEYPLPKYALPEGPRRVPGQVEDVSPRLAMGAALLGVTKSPRTKVRLNNVFFIKSSLIEGYMGFWEWGC